MLHKEIKKAISYYMLADVISASVTWLCILFFRKSKIIEIHIDTFFQSLTQKDVFFTLMIIPLFWTIMHLLSGAYFNPYRKSRFNELYRTLIISAIGCIIIYFIFIINDKAVDISYYYTSFFTYLFVQFVVTSFCRMLVLSGIKKAINSGSFGYKTLMIGGNQKAISIYKEIVQNEVKLGYNFKGFVYADETGNNGMSTYLTKLGSIDELDKIIAENNIEEVIIAIDTSEHNKLQTILSNLSHTSVIIKITPDLYDIISGSVKTSNVFAAVLIEIYPELMPDWQRVLKRTIDILASILVLLFLSPLYLFAAIRVKLSSPGSIFYTQERIGLNGKAFQIIKFRSMIENAEDKGPALSSEHDSRITSWGKFMRKWRIDELPQFLNILKSEMSLVGPRPERKHYIDLISAHHSHYKYLHRVKPGLTSWGMVKFGYAENVNEMIERMKYDLLYIKNCSLVLDFKIMIYTILVILQGRGK
jgi:exopolysaccharide biosynthesis polyprenyl glycosylphosphotransferase